MLEAIYESLPPGWLAIEEAELLWNEVRKASGDVLEIGTYRGRSAILLAEALAGMNRHLYCCDPFLVGFDGQDTPSQDAIIFEVLGHLCRGRFSPKVSICWQTEESLHANWPSYIQRPSFVYIDGEHSCAEFAGVKQAAQDYGLGSPARQVGSMAIFYR